MYGVERSTRHLGYSVVAFVPDLVERVPGRVADGADERKTELMSGVELAAEKIESRGDKLQDGGLVLDILSSYVDESMLEEVFDLEQNESTGDVHIRLLPSAYETKGVVVDGKRIVEMVFCPVVEMHGDPSVFNHGVVELVIEELPSGLLASGDL